MMIMMIIVTIMNIIIIIIVIISNSNSHNDIIFVIIIIVIIILSIRCQVAKGVSVRNKASPKKSKRPVEKHKEEVIVVYTKTDDEGDERNGFPADGVEVKEAEGMM